ncbi:hypothetical protein EJ04DRAFT_571320 [Polyplosphaeria fusca]|uniref:Uncharacterized protein n=1 Tax=Polyplosphaeria fusca TaxID=682080 RepID=A0A9P4UV51_9PLEO|nr:hypothetical protein EJ04DRAFT_571320 [Polyplosphaeria fusca]
MPIRAPPGALLEAFRVHCLRVVRAFACGKKPVYSFEKASSSKCTYCTKGNEKCNPIPDYCSDEYAAFMNALDAWNKEDNEAEKADIFTVVKSEAKVLSDVVKVTQAGETGLSVPELLLANHGRLGSLEDSVKKVGQAIKQSETRKVLNARRRKAIAFQTLSYSDEEDEGNESMEL